MTLMKMTMAFAEHVQCEARDCADYTTREDVKDQKRERTLSTTANDSYSYARGSFQ
jgi:hypothetical protein